MRLGVKNFGERSLLPFNKTGKILTQRLNDCQHVDLLVQKLGVLEGLREIGG